MCGTWSKVTILDHIGKLSSSPIFFCLIINCYTYSHFVLTKTLFVLLFSERTKEIKMEIVKKRKGERLSEKLSFSFHLFPLLFLPYQQFVAKSWIAEDVQLKSLLCFVKTENWEERINLILISLSIILILITIQVFIENTKLENRKPKVYTSNFPNYIQRLITLVD